MASFMTLPVEMQNIIIATVVNGSYNSIEQLKKNTERAMSLICDDFMFYTPFGSLLALNERGVHMNIKFPFISPNTYFGKNKQSIIELIDLYRRRRIVSRNTFATSAYLKKWAEQMLQQSNSI